MFYFRKIVLLDDYKNNKIYFDIFECLFKSSAYNKTSILQDSIGYKKYERMRRSNSLDDESKNTLLSLFKLKPVSKEEIDDFEDLLNEISYACFYKNDGVFDEYIEVLYSYSQNRNVLYAIAILMRLFVLLNKSNNLIHTINTNKSLYEEVKIYETFYVGILKKIFVCIDSIFNLKKYDKILTSKVSDYGFTSYHLGILLFEKKQYLYSILSFNQAMTVYNVYRNNNRIIDIDIYTTMSLIFIGNYNDAYTSARRAFFSIMNIESEKKDILCYLLYCVLILIDKKPGAEKLFASYKNNKYIKALKDNDLKLFIEDSIMSGCVNVAKLVKKIK